MRDTGLLAPVRAETAICDLVDDDAWIAAMIRAEIALATAQARVGMIPAAVPNAIAAATRSGRVDAAVIARGARGAANPVVCFVSELTRVVAEADPESANYVHRGSTSQDILDTAAMLIATAALTAIAEDLRAVAAALADIAREYRDAPTVARTLGMHAVPTTFGAKAAVWLVGVLDALDRIRPLAEGSLPVQLGGAGGTLAAYIECARGTAAATEYPDPTRLCAALTSEFAAELGLSEPAIPWHTVRTPLADIAAALAVASGALGKLAVDAITLSRNEIGEVLEPAAPGRGESSAMPQKRNPALSTLIRSAALQVPALVTILHGCLIAEDERPAGAWHAEWMPLREILLLVGGAAETAVELCAGLTVDIARMRANLDATAGAVVSERLSVALAPILGKLAAKDALHRATTAAEQSGRPLAAVLEDDPQLAERMSPSEIRALLLPENYLGMAPAIADAAVRRYESTYGEYEATRGERVSR